jgi:hypothetical protein
MQGSKVYQRMAAETMGKEITPSHDSKAKPSETLALAGVQPETVFDYLYFSRTSVV